MSSSLPTVSHLFRITGESSPVKIDKEDGTSFVVLNLPVVANSPGDKVKKSIFFASITLYDDAALYVARRAEVGQQIFVEGRLVTETYTRGDNTGHPGSTNTVVKINNAFVKLLAKAANRPEGSKPISKEWFATGSARQISPFGPEDLTETEAVSVSDEDETPY